MFGPPFIKLTCALIEKTETANAAGRLPFDVPMTCATEYLGGIEIIICTWSAIRCLSSIWHSFCPGNSRITRPNSRGICPYNTFFRHFGMNTMRYLHSDYVCFSVSYVCIGLDAFALHGLSPFSVSPIHTPETSGPDQTP
jgi:hypothetical protein